MTSIRCRIIGVDPGQRGAVAYIERDDDGKIIDVRVMKCITKPDGYIDSNRMADLIRVWPVAYLAVLEKQIQKQGKGIDTMFTNYGLLMGVVERCAHIIEEVHSRTWKSRLKLSKDKSESIAKVHELMREWAHLLKQTKRGEESPDIAEAMLIAWDAHERVWIPQDLGKIGMLL